LLTALNLISVQQKQIINLIQSTQTERILAVKNVWNKYNIKYLILRVLNIEGEYGAK
jgi:hypothetical protein